MTDSRLSPRLARREAVPERVRFVSPHPVALQYQQHQD